eukprot:946696-Pyramimonas_sp.AAC.1
MYSRVLRFARAARKYAVTAKLERPGTLAAQLYAHQIHGVFGSAMIRCRRQMGAVWGSGKKVRCLMTLLDLRAPMGDPAVYYPRLCFEFWMRQWIMQPSI